MKRSGFTLIELLTVVAIVTLLVAILIPTLGRARQMSKLTVCASNLRQLGMGVTAYANLNRQIIPLGPGYKNGYKVTDGTGQRSLEFREMATNQIWAGRLKSQTDPLPYCGLGILLRTKAASPPVYFCPGDISEDEVDEQPKVEKELSEDAYSSYLYRQQQKMPSKATLADFGDNLVKRPSGQDTKVKIQALAMDVQTTGPGKAMHMNHQGQKVNILFQDTSVRDFANTDEWLNPPTDTIKAGIFSVHDTHMQPVLATQDATALSKRLDEMFIRADFAYGANPIEAPIGRAVEVAH